MSFEKELETKVEEVWRADTVQKAERVVKSRAGLAVLAAISFTEAALPVPLVTDPFLIAAVLVDRTRVVRLVVVTTLASMVGGVCAYLMALWFLDVLLTWLSPEMVTQFQALVNGTQTSTLVLTLVGALSPVPYTLAAWVVAAVKGSLLVFIVGSFLGRGFRYVVVGYTTYQFGPVAISYIKRYAWLVSTVVIVAAVLYFWLKM